MSDALKYEIAQELGIYQKPSPDQDSSKYEMASELGVYDAAQPIDWGSVSREIAEIW